MSAALIRKALANQPCPACTRKTLISGLFLVRRTCCLWCGARVRVRLAFRRGAPRIELNQPRVARQYGARRA